MKLIQLYKNLYHHKNHMQSHPNNTRGKRRLSLAALPGRPAASRCVKLPLLANALFFSHCNTGNFVNIPVHVNKTTSRR